jgi:hypothetical protein
VPSVRNLAKFRTDGTVFYNTYFLPTCDPDGGNFNAIILLHFYAQNRQNVYKKPAPNRSIFLTSQVAFEHHLKVNIINKKIYDNKKWPKKQETEIPPPKTELFQ